MTGDRLTRLLRGVLHEDTFALFVAPAIADLQHAPSPAAYAAVWTSFIGAICDDVSSDVTLLVNDIGLMLGLVAMQACYYGGMLLLLVADLRVDEALRRLVNGGGLQVIVMVAGVLVASAIPTLFCVWPPRRALDA